MPAPPTGIVADRLEQLRRRIASAGGDPSAVRIVAVTKGFDISAVRVAIKLGLTEIGENYPGELLSKAGDLLSEGDEVPGVTWNMIGRIQRRTIRSLAPVVGCWQTVSRAEEIRSLSASAGGAEVFIQVETTGLPGRNGSDPEEVAGLVAAAREAGLVTRGLMTIGPPGAALDSAPGFELVASLARDLGLGEVSMGMTEDLEIAVRSGSTMLRVGRALFGPRAEAAT
jgi:PLP dependent protein